MNFNRNPYYFNHVRKIDEIIMLMLNLNSSDLRMIDAVENLLDKLELFRIASNKKESDLILNYMKAVQNIIHDIEYVIINDETRTKLKDSYTDYLLSLLDLEEYEKHLNTGRNTGHFSL